MIRVHLFRDRPRRDQPPSWRASCHVGRNDYVISSPNAPVHALARYLIAGGVPDDELAVCEGYGPVVTRHKSFFRLGGAAAKAA